MGYGIPALYYSHEVMCKNSKKCTLTITYEDSVLETNNSSNSEGTINNRGTYSIEFYVPKALSIEFNEYETYEEYLDFYEQYDGIICETITEKLG